MLTKLGVESRRFKIFPNRDQLQPKSRQSPLKFVRPLAVMSRRAPVAAQPPKRLSDPDESNFKKFMREQLWAPEMLPGNINVLAAVGLFVGGIVGVRLWGDMLIPA